MNILMHLNSVVLKIKHLSVNLCKYLSTKYHPLPDEIITLNEFINLYKLYN